MSLTIENLIAKEEIRDVILRRARAADRKDVELARSCYHPGATEDHGGFIGPAEEFMAQSPITAPEDAPIKLMWHSVANILIEFTGEESAKVESYTLCTMTIVLGGLEYTMQVGGRYLDDFERREGRWGITARILVFDWSKVDPSTVPYWVAMDKQIDRLPFGASNGADPLHGFLIRP